MSKKQKPAVKYTLKEIYESYYWLVTNYNLLSEGREFVLFDSDTPLPIKLYYLEIDANGNEHWNRDMYSPYGFPESTWFPEPECLVTAIKEIGDWGKTNVGRKDECLFFYKYNSDVQTVGGSVFKTGCWRYYIDDLFIWCTKQIGKDYLLHLNGKQIACVADIRRTCDDVGVENLKASLAPEHFQHLTELSLAGAGKGEGGNVTSETHIYNWDFNKEKHTVRCNGSNPVKLQPIPFKIWYYLYTNPNKDVKPDTLFRKGWGKKEYPPRYKRSVQDAVNKLRSKLKACGLSKETLDMIIQDVKDGKYIIAYKFNTKNLL